MSPNDLPGGGTSEDPMVVDSDGSSEPKKGDKHPEGEPNEDVQVQQGATAETRENDAFDPASTVATPSLGTQASAASAIPNPPGVGSRPTPAGVSNVGGQQQDPTGSNQGTLVSAPLPTPLGGQASRSAVSSGSHSGVTGAVTTRTSKGRRKGYGPVVGGQQARHKDETLSLDPSKPNSILARFRIQIPGEKGSFFEQVDEIPLLDATAVEPKEPEYYFLRNPALAKIPARKRANKENNHNPPVWVRQPGTQVWRRSGAPGAPDEVWKLVVIFRRMNKATQRYEEPYVSKSKLNKVNPNDKEFMYAYNKWIDQFRRRRDETYNKTTNKDHWTVPERRALMEGINTFVAKKGLKKFGKGASMGMNNEDLKVVAEHVNAVGGKDRGVDATRAQILSAHVKKNKAIFELRRRAAELRASLANGESISRVDRYPKEAIPRWQFPVEDKSSRPKKPKNSKKPTVEQNDDSDREQSLTPPAHRCSGLTSSALSRLNMNGPGVRPTYPNRVRTSIIYGEMPGWEDVDEDDEDMDGFYEREEVEDQSAAEQEPGESAWESTNSDCSYADVDEEPGLDEQDNEALSYQEATDLQSAITESLREHRAVGANDSVTRGMPRAAGDSGSHSGPITIGIGPPDDSDGSSSGESEVPARAPVPASRSPRPITTAGSPSTPEKSKRKRAPEVDNEDEGSAGDDEAEMSPPQGRKIKKPRMLARK
ncbi:hypothetical protein FB567DRAFT_609564 [Paraphoma chrysanthemicola]|uniref:Uncharacterized protein n=1 Tax=Paraphoma chrysanthemicola TaxID=798071 RepID=A0A8K0W3X6_9PLEO|nr:hypothetical protein FB567DRAFT_609564 [Paraphoma chrysanthemicola]